MITEVIKGYELTFETNANCFSPRYIDKGTLAMLSYVDFITTDKVLDLGCGYGIVGIIAAKFCDPKNIFLVDISEIAIQCAKQNARRNNADEVTIIQGDAYKNFEETGFNLILSNPPYHADFSVAKEFIKTKSGVNKYVFTMFTMIKINCISR